MFPLLSPAGLLVCTALLVALTLWSLARKQIAPASAGLFFLSA
jgi:hypothetical protein